MKSIITIATCLCAAVVYLSLTAASSPAAEHPDTLSVDTAYIEIVDTLPQPEPEIYQHGKATYYSRKWHGRKTSSGERLNMNGYQAAHRSLPFGTLVKVTNKKNGKWCVVRVIDRGPFGKGMVIDLTTQAAKHIGMLQSGIAQVQLEVLPADTKVVDGVIVEE